VYLAIGTGVGGCVVLDGQIVRHTHGGSGHLGHLVVDTSSRARRCACGARGCLEAVIGGAALDRRLAQAARRGPAGLADVYTRAAAGLAVGLVQIAHLYAPDVVLAGGGVIEGEPGLVDAAAQVLVELRGTLVPANLRFERAPLLSADAGVIGAALLP
jgi:glucokinase